MNNLQEKQLILEITNTNKPFKVEFDLTVDGLFSQPEVILVFAPRPGAILYISCKVRQTNDSNSLTMIAEIDEDILSLLKKDTQAHICILVESLIVEVAGFVLRPIHRAPKPSFFVKNIKLSQR